MLVDQKQQHKTVDALKLFLREHIKGQDHVIEEVAPMLIAGELGVFPKSSPKGRFLFVGPTGTGKTEITKLAAKYLFGNEDKLIRFNMSDFGGSEGMKKFVGESNNPRGAIGNKIANRNTGFLLFDEFEKASSEVIDLFLQILDIGHITLWNGDTLNLNEFYIVCTSNIGSSKIKDMIHSSYSAKKQAILSSLESYLRMELIGRFRNVIVFNSLSYTVLKNICRSIIDKEIERLNLVGFSLKVSDEVVRHLVKVGFDEKFGARPMKDAIESNLGKLISTDFNIYLSALEKGEPVEITISPFEQKLSFRSNSQAGFHQGNCVFDGILELNLFRSEILKKRYQSLLRN